MARVLIIPNVQDAQWHKPVVTAGNRNKQSRSEARSCPLGIEDFIAVRGYAETLRMIMRSWTIEEQGPVRAPLNDKADRASTRTRALTPFEQLDRARIADALVEVELSNDGPVADA